MGMTLPELRQEVSHLQDVARHYRAGNQLEFDMASHTYERSLLNRAKPNRAIRHLDIELLYNRLDLFYRSKILYGFAFLLGLVGILSGWKWVRISGVLLVVAAAIPHAIGIIWRMMIMGRPPMTNLYATFLFVAFVVVVLGLIVEWFQRNNLGTRTALRLPDY